MCKIAKTILFLKIHSIKKTMYFLRNIPSTTLSDSNLWSKIVKTISLITWDTFKETLFRVTAHPILLSEAQMMSVTPNSLEEMFIMNSKLTSNTKNLSSCQIISILKRKSSPKFINLSQLRHQKLNTISLIKRTPNLHFSRTNINK